MKQIGVYNICIKNKIMIDNLMCQLLINWLFVVLTFPFIKFLPSIKFSSSEEF